MEFIVNAFERTGKSITTEQAKRICEVTKCHSWYVQQLSFFIWNSTDTVVTDDIFNRALQRLIDTNAPMFQNDVEQLTASQKAMLQAVSHGNYQFAAEATKRMYAMGNANSIARNKRILQDKDYIEQQGHKFSFVDPIFQLWFNQEYNN